MKQYLGVWRDDRGARHVAVADRPAAVLSERRGQTSPIFSANGGTHALDLTTTGALLFLLSKSPNQLLARLMNDFGEDLPRRTFVTHGHAAAVLALDDSATAEQLLRTLGDDVFASELWPLQGDVIDEVGVRIIEPPRAEQWSSPVPVDPRTLTGEARAQVQQFNANLSVLDRIVSRYAPELHPLIHWIEEAVADVVGLLVQLDEDGGDSARRESLGLQVNLVETNAVLTLYTSQIGSGTLPICDDIFSVGEYSLLGIGTLCRGAWRIYTHLNRTFAEHDHAGLIRNGFKGQQAFPPYAPEGRIDYSDWAKLAIRMEDLEFATNNEARQHMPYYSSRWGFHESLQSISLSWQCLYASATRDWNLLTTTHEYLHAHVRDILGVILTPASGDLAEDLAAAYNSKAIGNNAFESLRIAYVEALVSIGAMTALAGRIDGVAQTESETIRATITSKDLRRLNAQHRGVIDEIIVHVLDFWYVYAGKDDQYISSIWRSWSLVPSVVNKVPYYVLRTIAALASTSSGTTNPQLFEDARARLQSGLLNMSDEIRRRPVIAEALHVLEDPEAQRKLAVQFMAARFVVELASNFLKDSRLNAALLRDDLTVLEADGNRTYDYSVGDYPGQVIESPIGFLLDRFKTYDDSTGSDATEHESIWQMLQLV